MNKRILFVVNEDWFFLSHRLNIALAIQNRGYEIHLAANFSKHEAHFREMGFFTHEIQMSRSGLNPFKEILTIFRLIQVFSVVRPRLVHLITIKPVIYGGIISQFTGNCARVFAISGLGYVFSSKSIALKFIKTLILILYRLVLSGKNMRVIFQNANDREVLLNLSNLNEEMTVLIPGSGVNLDEFRFSNLNLEKPLILMASRLLAQKGIWEFVEAARVLKRKGVEAHFCLVGDLDIKNPSSLTKGDLKTIQEAGEVEVLGFCEDMPSLLLRSTLVVLPSYYGEGLPKILIEAAACGRPVITTDMPGCRDAIIDGKTGLLVEPGNTKQLTDAIQYLLEDHKLLVEMGKNARAFSESQFSSERIVEMHMRIYDDLIALY